MYLYSSVEGTAAVKLAQDAFMGLGMQAEAAAQVARVETWASTFSDPGPDQTELRAFDVAGHVLRRRMIAGY